MKELKDYIIEQGAASIQEKVVDLKTGEKIKNYSVVFHGMKGFETLFKSLDIYNGKTNEIHFGQYDEKNKTYSIDMENVFVVKDDKIIVNRDDDREFFDSPEQFKETEYNAVLVI